MKSAAVNGSLRLLLSRCRLANSAIAIPLRYGTLEIQADVVGKKVPTSASEVIKVSFASTDGLDKVEILDRPEDP